MIGTGGRSGVGRVGALVACALLAAACTSAPDTLVTDPGSTPEPGSASGTAGTSSRAARPGVEVTTSRVPFGGTTGRPSPATFTMAFAGDIHFDGRARTALQQPGRLSVLGRTVGAADLAVANLETAVGTGGQRMPGKQYTFRAPASALTVLDAAGFDVLSMANNHAVDFGPDVLDQTLEAKKRSPVPIVGIGADVGEAFKPVELTVNGTSIAVLASSQVRDLTGLRHAATAGSPGIAANLDPTELRRAVRSAATDHDVVVVVMHWGTEQLTCADARQRQTAADLTADGADIVVGGHGHRPQGSGWLGSSYVAYGLGNFIWYQNVAGSGDSGVLTLTVDAAYAASTTRGPARDDRRPRDRSVVTTSRWDPMRIGDDGVPRPLSGTPAASGREAWAASAECGSLRVDR